MRADSWSNVSADARGRDSIRITSEATYNEALIVLDLVHMPHGCATWPAFWTFSAAGPWPTGGEVDIIEGFFVRVFQRYSRLNPSRLQVFTRELKIVSRSILIRDVLCQMGVSRSARLRQQIAMLLSTSTLGALLISQNVLRPMAKSSINMVAGIM